MSKSPAASLISRVLCTVLYCTVRVWSHLGQIHSFGFRWCIVPKNIVKKRLHPRVLLKWILIFVTLLKNLAEVVDALVNTIMLQVKDE